MPKMKTNKGALKRFKVTKTGKVLRGKSFANHMLEKKSPDRKRGYASTTGLAKGDLKNVKKLLGV